MLERLDEAINRWTGAAGLSPKGASALRLVGAAPVEIGEGRQTGREALTMGPG